MQIQPVHEDLFAHVMRDISGARFERLTKRIFASVFGEAFAPLGGIHDGGADGVISSFVQEVTGKPNTFAQFSATDPGRAKGKILDTVEMLRKVGRTPRQVIYATSEKLPKADLIVQEVFDEHGVMVAVRDYERIRGYVNDTLDVNRAFYDEFAPDIDRLAKAANLRHPVVSQFANDPTVFVFLNHELRDRFSRDHLNSRVLDALIYWTLRATDPDGIRLNRDRIAAEIQAAFPTAKSVLLPLLDSRLTELSKKSATGEERLRHYNADGTYCLPFSMRTSLAMESATAEAHQRAFRNAIEHRLTEESGGQLKSEEMEACATLVFVTVHRYFVDQGVVLAAFYEGRLGEIQIADQVVEDTMVKALSELEGAKKVSPEMMGYCMAAMRGVFYRSSDVERLYMGHLSRTSCLLVTMQSAPRLLEYLNQMGGNFRFLVGADLIVKALSEQYLPQEQQQVATLLLVSKKLGSELVLTEPVLEEVFTHIRAADLEFENHYLRQEPYLKRDLISECDRILIRAYFHAKLGGNGPKSWKAYIDQFTDPAGLRARSEAARQALKGLLTQRFGMDYMSVDELKSMVPAARVQELAQKLEESRQAKHEVLSYNDALMVYATYAQRHIHKESGIYDGFGFRTWWLTKETTILSMTGALVLAEGGTPYIMRPEFILNFIALAPKAAEVRKAFGALLPTTAGLQLGRYLRQDVMHSLLDDVQKWAELPPERVAVILGERVNRLKHDRFKQYSQQIGQVR